jgi:hypothetical protein
MVADVKLINQKVHFVPSKKVFLCRRRIARDPYKASVRIVPWI